MLLRMIYAVPFALIFMTMSNQWEITGLIVGYLFGLATLLLIGEMPGRIVWGRLPFQLFWLMVYITWLVWEILLSGFDVARRVLDPKLPIHPGELVVPIQDEEERVIVSALSAHAISVTPGELVIGFSVIDGKNHMIVHSLDIDVSRQQVEQSQTKRLKLLKRIMGDRD
ncbi:MAG: Na+/H+ antiporter subunit E [Aggregatilineales bacterium]